MPTLPGTPRLQCGDCAIPVIIRDPESKALPLTADQIQEFTQECARRLSA